MTATVEPSQIFERPVFIDPETIPTVCLHADAVVAAFTTAHASDTPDVIALQQQLMEQDAKVGTPALRPLPIAGPFLGALFTSTVAAPPALIGYGAYRGYKRLRSEETHTKDLAAQHEEGLVAHSKRLGTELGGLSCLLWRSAADKKIYIEVGDSEQPEDAEQIMTRLRFLEQSLTDVGKRGMLGGFILPECVSEHVSAAQEPTPYVDILKKLHPSRNMSGDELSGERLLLSTVLDSKEDIRLQSSQEKLLALLREYDPHHPILRTITTQTTTKGIQQLARQCLEERLAEVKRHGMTGRKTQTHVMVAGKLILSYDEAGVPTQIPTRTLMLDADALGYASTDTVLACVEYALYRGNDIVNETTGKTEHVQPIVAQQDIQIKVASPTSFEYTSKQLLDKNITSYERVHHYRLSERETKQRNRRMVLALLAIGAAGFHLIDVESRIPGNEPLPISTPVHPAEVSTLQAVQGFFDTIIDDRIPHIPVEKEAGSVSLEQQLQDQLAHMQEADSSDPNKVLESDKNRALWYMNTFGDISPSGYWGTVRYDALVEDGDGSFRWQAPDPLQEARSEGSIAEITELGRLQETKTSALPTIEVSGAVGFNEQTMYTDEAGVRWQAVRVPVLHDMTILNGTVSVHKNVKHYMLQETRIWQGSSGSVLFVRLPDDFILPTPEDPVAYMQVSYHVGNVEWHPFTPNPKVQHMNTVTFDEDARAQDVGTVLTNKQLLSTRYEVSPIEGDDIDGDERYTFFDLASETKQRGTANCFTANSLYVALKGGEVSPVGGFYLSGSNVMFDQQHNPGGVVVLAQRDSHLYTVAIGGTIIDATPGSLDPDTADYFNHQVLEPGNASADVFVNATESQKLQDARREEQEERDLRNVLGIAALTFSAFGAVYGATWLGRRRNANLFRSDDERMIRASQLAQLAGFKLQGNPGARITRADISSATTFASPNNLAMLDHKQVKKALRSDRRAETYRYAYTVTDMKRAVRMVKLAKQEAKGQKASL